MEVAGFGPVRPVGQIGQTGWPLAARKCVFLVDLGSSGPRPDHPDLLSSEHHCLAGSSGVTQDDPRIDHEKVLE